MYKFFVSILVLGINSMNYGAPAIVNGTEDLGRLGDQIVAVLNAQWAAYKHNLPIFYTPIELSENFMLHSREKHCTPEIIAQFDEVKLVDNLSKIDPSPDLNILYKVSYSFTDDAWPLCYEDEEHDHFEGVFEQLRDEKPFYEKMKELLSPSKQVDLIKPPVGSHSVAVHVRTGGDFENAETIVFSGPKSSKYREKRSFKKEDLCFFYVRFLPIEWYANQIRRLSRLLKKRKLYVYVFTDDSHPEDVVEILKGLVKCKGIEWDWRKEGNKHDKNIIEDLWSMASFDYMIRPWSQFSKLAEFLGDPKIVISPHRHEQDDTSREITSWLKRKGRNPILIKTKIDKF